MDKWMDGWIDAIMAKFKDRLMELQEIFFIEKGLPLELNKKQCAKMFGVDTATFDARFNCHNDFPKIKGKRDKFPRDAVIEWYHKNWRRTAV